MSVHLNIDRRTRKFGPLHEAGVIADDTVFPKFRMQGPNPNHVIGDSI